MEALGCPGADWWLLCWCLILSSPAGRATALREGGNALSTLQNAERILRAHCIVLCLSLPVAAASCSWSQLRVSMTVCHACLEIGSNERGREAAANASWSTGG